MPDDPTIFTKEDYDHFASESESVAPALAGVLVEFFNPKSVVDVGCGLGIYLRELAELGIEVRGYDISPYALEHSLAPPGTVTYHDLREPLPERTRYDLCICNGVAEHLDAKYADHVVSLVAGLSDTVYWGAGEPGSGDRTHHLNEQRPDYWMERFEALGYRFDGGTTDRVKAAVQEACPGVWRNVHIWGDCMIYRREPRGDGDEGEQTQHPALGD